MSTALKENSHAKGARGQPAAQRCSKSLLYGRSDRSCWKESGTRQARSLFLWN